MAVKAIPDGYHSVTPYLCTKEAAHAIEFYKRAFSAVERMRITQPDGPELAMPSCKSVTR